MIKILHLSLLLPIFILGFFLVSQAGDLPKYKYLFRNVILSESQQYELEAVLRGRVYYPRYFYIPSLKQYMVYSSLDENGDFRVREMNKPTTGKAYSLVDETGNIVSSFETPLRFSYRSGCFYGPATYIPFLETGQTDTLPYHQIHNSTLDMSETAFKELFTELYKTADYVEFINLRASGDNKHQAGIIFKRQGKVEILLSGLHKSHMTRYFQKEETINNFDDYYLPSMRNKDTYPQSAPSIEMIPLETTDTNPFLHRRRGSNKEFRIKRFEKEYSTGWHGIMTLGIIPIYVPGASYGTTYVQFTVNNDVFKIKILDVEKRDYSSVYNLGLRTFKLPAHLQTAQSLVFMESVQNADDNRLGGGVFVVRPARQTNPSADIPSDMTEAYFNTLPLNLQEALVNSEKALGLIITDKSITKWMPEIERLPNLTYLEMTTGMTEIPDAISKLPKLQKLSVKYGDVARISPQLAELTELRTLDIFSNQLTGFPLVVLKLKHLQWLNIGGNNITTLPAEISTLEELEYLSIVLTEINTLPESMSGMEKLYIDNSSGLENNLAPEFKHLFDVLKTVKRTNTNE